MHHLMLNDIPGALGWETRPMCINGFACHGQFIEYDQRAFHARAFNHAGIVLPAAFTRSLRTRQAEFFFGRLAAALALKQMGVANCSVGIGPAREPLFPTAVRGAITHSKAWAAAIALPSAGCRGAGLDIESPVDEHTIDAVEQLVLDTLELRILRRCSALPHAVLLALVFSAKESFYKAVYSTVQRFLEFSAIKLDGIDLVRHILRFRLPASLCADWQEGDVCEIGFTFLPGGEVVTSFAW